MDTAERTYLHRLQESLCLRRNQALFELEEKEGVKLEWLPYTLRIPEFMGTVEERTPHFWRKVRYSYGRPALCQRARADDEGPAANL